MSPIVMFSLLLSLCATLNSSLVYAAGMQDDVNQAATILERFQKMPEKAIPREVLRDAKGLAIMTVVKAGYMLSARGGTGVVVARNKRGWSGPSAIGTGGAGFGLQIGAEVTEFVFVLNTNNAVEAFAKGGNIQLGAGLSVAAGPVGRTAEAAVTPIAAVYSYSRSQGLFAGISLEGAVIVARDDANAEYYGRPVTPEQILHGNVKLPHGANILRRELATL
jgi:SH3 domain-containing YSC84-like protein 1